MNERTIKQMSRKRFDLQEHYAVLAFTAELLRVGYNYSVTTDEHYIVVIWETY